MIKIESDSIGRCKGRAFKRRRPIAIRPRTNIHTGNSATCKASGKTEPGIVRSNSAWSAPCMDIRTWGTSGGSPIHSVAGWHGSDARGDYCYQRCYCTMAHALLESFGDATRECLLVRRMLIETNRRGLSRHKPVRSVSTRSRKAEAKRKVRLFEVLASEVSAKRSDPDTVPELHPETVTRTGEARIV
jgi:hypothetical protein